MYTLRLALAQFSSPATGDFGVTLADGRYRVAARFMGVGAATGNLDMQGVALLNFWKGEALSAAIDVDVSNGVVTPRR